MGATKTGTIGICLLIISCSDPGGDHSGNSSTDNKNRVQVTMTSTQLSSVLASGGGQKPAFGRGKLAPRINAGAVESVDCSMQLFRTGSNTSSDPNINGQCLTPINVSGYVEAGDFSHTDFIEAAIDDPWAIGQAQIFSLDGIFEDGTWIQSAPYDLLTAEPFEGGVTASDTPDINWSRVSTSFESMNVQFQMGDEFWTVRYNFRTFPLLDDPVIDNCITDEHLRSGMAAEATSRPAVHRNDVQVCVRSDATACTDGEFQWLDMDTEQFASTRPTNPFQLKAASDSFCEVSSTERSGYSFGFGGFSTDALMVDDAGNTVTINYWAVENGTPYKQYHYVGWDGATGEGNSPAITLDYDLTNAIFVNADAIVADAGVQDWETADRATIFQNLYLKQIYLQHRVNTDDSYYFEDTGLRVKVTVGFNEDIVWTPPEDGAQPENN